MLKPFTIHQPTNPQEASEMLRNYGWEAAPYAGGTELLVLMREGLSHYPHLVDVKTITDFNSISLVDGTLVIGAGTTHHQIETSETVLAHAPLLAEVEAQVANLRVRIAGTIGGNLCFAEPHSDPATLFTAWNGATFVLQSSEKTREVAATDFFHDLFVTDCAEDEVMTAIRLPLQAATVQGAFEKFAMLHRPSANVACFINLVDAKIESAQIAVGAVGPIPYRATEAEALLTQEIPTEALIRQVSDVTAQLADPVSDIYGSADYKRHLVQVLTQRTLTRAIAKAVPPA